MHEVTQNILSMMEELWQSWSHLGVNTQTKLNYLKEILHIEKELHRDVLSETRQKLKVMEETINSEFLMFFFFILILLLFIFIQYRC